MAGAAFWNKILFIAVGLVLTGIGVFLLLRKIKLKKACTAQVSGTVTDCSQEVKYSKGKKKTTYITTFTYSVGGVEYVKSTKRKSSVGQSVAVYYDPSDPNRHYAHSAGIFGELLVTAFGVLFAGAGFFVGFLGN